MSQVRPMPVSDIEAFISITANAYPGFQLDTQEARRRDSERLKAIYEDPSRQIHGLYRGDKLLGGMIYYDFDMTFVSSRLPAGGVGLVAVDLMHRKEKVAHDMMKDFIYHYRNKGTSLLMLYPFRPDFYKRMGFGYGTKISYYRFRPDALPRGGFKDRLRYLDLRDKDQIMACYNQVASTTHGMILRNGLELNYHFERPTTVFVGYFDKESLEGYMLLNFERGGNFLENDLSVTELVYQGRQALSGLLTFLATQLDQVQWISLNTHNETFHHLLSDPRDDSGRMIPPVYHESNTQGVGLMYRVVDIPALFRDLKDHDFGVDDLRLRLAVADNFVPENDSVTSIQFDKGKPRLVDSEDFDVEIQLDVSDFSSMIVGTVGFKDLHTYQLAEISDTEYVDVVDRLFETEAKPVCLTRF